MVRSGARTLDLPHSRLANAVYNDEAKGKGAIFRSKIRWIEKGEKPTRYFFNLEKRNYHKKIVSQLYNGEEEL